MGQFIIKAAPDQDMYLIWSTVVDAPVMVFGTRQSLREYLWWELNTEPPAEDFAGAGGPFEARNPDSRIARADANGTSVIGDSFGSWDDEAMWVREGTPDDGWRYQLRRDKVGAYIQAFLDGGENEANKHLERFERIEN